MLKLKSLLNIIDTIPAEFSVIKESIIIESNKEEKALEFLKELVKLSPYKGNVFLAGGAVRDMEMGQKPKDLDVVVIGDSNGSIKFTTWIAKKLGNFKGPTTPPPKPPPHIEVDSRGYPVFSPDESDPELIDYLKKYNDYYHSFTNPVLFPRFGTAKVNLTGTYKGVKLDGMEVEAVSSRKETYIPGSRKPIVTHGTLKDDVFRRDFTVNSLVMDLTTGEILDLTGKGKDDIKNGIIRTTVNPEIIFKEDPLRMLRAVRFMVQKGWKIDPETEENIKLNAPWLQHISKERIHDELNKMLISKDAPLAIRKLKELNLLSFISPELVQMSGMTQNIHHVHDVFDHTMEVLKNTNPELITRLMALFHDVGKIATRSETPTGVHFYGHEEVGEEIAEKILRNLKYPNDIIDAVKMGVRNHMRLKQYGDNPVKLSDKTLRKFKFELGNNIEHILDLIHADNLAHAPASAMPNQIEAVRNRLKQLDIKVENPSLPINGNDIINLGIPPGPKIKEILSVVLEAWYDNPNLTKEEAIEIAKGFI